MAAILCEHVILASWKCWCGTTRWPVNTAHKENFRVGDYIIKCTDVLKLEKYMFICKTFVVYSVLTTITPLLLAKKLVSGLNQQTH